MPPHVYPGTMNNKEVKRITHFENESLLLLFIFVVYNEDVDIMRYMNSTMTWYEEYFLF